MIQYIETPSFIEFEEMNNGKTKVVVKHHILAEQIIDELPLYRDSDEQYYHYKKETGLWTRKGTNALLGSIIKQKLGQYYTKHHMTETLEHIKHSVFVPPENEVTFENKPYLINLKNGVYDAEKQIFSPEFSPFYYQTIKVPIWFDQNAECPKILTFLKQVFEKEEIAFFFEWLGYCLVKNYRYNNVLFLLGGGGNGKSRLIELIKQFIGITNSTAVSLHQLEENQFMAAELHNKLINTFADIKSTYLDQSAMLKTLTGSDLITAHRKAEHPFSFVNFAKLIFSANEMPTFRDHTDGFERRPLILPMDKPFKPHKEWSIEKITTDEELSGLLNMALWGLKRLMERNEFEETEQMKQAKIKWLHETNNVSLFLKEKCVIAPNATVGKEQLFAEYEWFCGKRLKPLGPTKFKKELERLVSTITEGRDETNYRNGGKRIRIYKGIRLE